MSRMHYQKRYSSLPVLSWLENEMQRARLAVARSYERLNAVNSAPGLADDDTALTAGDALREAELEAAQTDGQSAVGAAEPVSALGAADRQACSSIHRESLEQLSIDDLRAVASEVQVPDRSTITEKTALIDEICKRF